MLQGRVFREHNGFFVIVANGLIDIARLHAASAGNADIAQRFRTDAIFHAIRLEPYLLATAVRHPDIAPVLWALAARTAGTRIALVHGDVSPKNILLGARGPVLLDAECAWYGDPAFDAAFCLNHFLLKCVARPQSVDDCLGCYAAFADTYLAGVTWESRATVEARIASLLPALFLARIDGKSPVEYITDEGDRQIVRETARPLVAQAPARVDEISARWREALARLRAASWRHQPAGAPTRPLFERAQPTMAEPAIGGATMYPWTWSQPMRASVSRQLVDSTPSP